MANMCYFMMKVIGNKENIESFYKCLSQERNNWMGRGALASIRFEEDNIAFIDGDCKWSIQSALIDNALSMRKQKETGEGYWGGITKNDPRDFIPLDEATEKWDLIVEIFSEEPGFEFMEHYLIEKGEMVENECIDWQEIYVEDFETKEEAEEELNMKITDEEWERQYDTDGYIYRGGMDWDFQI